MAKKDTRWALSVDFFSVLLGWLLVWGMIRVVRGMLGIGRWVKQRFT